MQTIIKTRGIYKLFCYFCWYVCRHHFASSPGTVYFTAQKFLTLFTENACRLHRKLKAPLPSDSAYGFLNIIQVLNTHEEIREKIVLF